MTIPFSPWPDLFLVAAVAVFIVDISGFKEAVLTFASRLRGRTYTELRPLTCSLCVTWWAGLLLLLLSGTFSLGALALLAAASALTRPICSLGIFIIEGLLALADTLMRLLRL